MNNPYRPAFYAAQAERHGHLTAAEAHRHHLLRERYFAWYTKDWLPHDHRARLLDLGCGSGQFVHFLRSRGYGNAEGVDIDARQVALAIELQLPCRTASISEALARDGDSWDMISLLDVLEHLTPAESMEILSSVSRRLQPGASLLLSVPNAESPNGLAARYGDITHETAFTVASLDSLLRCHGLRIAATRDPWPAPVSALHAAHRAVAMAARRLESARLRLLGLRPPSIWSAVMWCLAIRA